MHGKEILLIFATERYTNIAIKSESNLLIQHDMKTKTYILRPVTDLRDFVLYYEFVRKEDDAILRSSKDYDFLLAYGEGYASAMNATFIVQ